jgi:hypothetical protein
MHIRYGCRIDVICDAPTLLVTTLDIHPSRRGDITMADSMVARALRHVRIAVPTETFLDGFGNCRRRLTMPAGGVILRAQGIIHHSGFAEDSNPDTKAVPPEELPVALLPFLDPSCFCETDKLAGVALRLFGTTPNGWDTVRAICDFAQRHIRFNSRLADVTQSAFEVFQSEVGVSRDYAHLAIALCRCLNIPARYCWGYLPANGADPMESEQTKSAWFEAYLGDRWWTFDARHNAPRIGHILIAWGRDAGDTPALRPFASCRIRLFRMLSEEVDGARYPISSARRREHSARQGLFAEARR